MATTKKPNTAPILKAKASTAERTGLKTPAPPSRSAAEMKAAATLEEAAAQSRAALQLQMKQWEQAVESFSRKQFDVARVRFAAAAVGPAAHISDKARSYAQICARKLSGADPDLRTADDHFNYGVERLNARDMDAARRHLEKALALEPNGEHILFTLALCCGLSGDGGAACEHMKRAIALEPKNRILARQDPEFHSLAQQIPAMRALLANDSTEGA